MKIRYDDVTAELPASAVNGLRDFLSGVCEAMRKADGASPECWTWGRAHIGDIAASDGINFEWGGEDDKPNDGAGQFGVTCCRPRRTDEGGGR